MNSYIPISSDSRSVSTFAIGVYKKEKEAHKAIVDFIFKHENGDITEFMKDENLKTKKEVSDLFYEKGFDSFDFNYTVDLFDPEVDTIYGFTQWSAWDLENLWDLLVTLKEGKTINFKQISLNYQNNEEYRQ